MWPLVLFLTSDLALPPLRRQEDPLLFLQALLCHSGSFHRKEGSSPGARGHLSGHFQVLI